MKIIQLFITCIFFLYPSVTQSQEYVDKSQTTYQVELSALASKGETTPFWQVSNRYGIVPLKANNGYVRTGLFHQSAFDKHMYWKVGLDIVAVTPRYKNIFIQQLFAEFGYKSLLLSIGSKENHHSLWDPLLSSGDLIQSANARPIPEINLSMPRFTVVPYTRGFMQIKGDFAFGRSFDTEYLKSIASPKQFYVEDVLWHHKSFYMRFQDSQTDFPLSATIGLQHWAQWGGTSTNPKIGKQPVSFKDFFRIISGSEGGKDATLADQINVLGNHFGSYDFKIAFIKPKWQLSAYHQHFFDDKSGTIFVNGTDGLWGIQLDIPHVQWIRKITLEHLTTRHQSGPFHFIDFDHDKHKGPGGGGDNYYNNGEYQTGISYFGRGLGSPLITGPEYNPNGIFGFRNNRVRVFYIGMEGSLSASVSFRIKASVTNSWGTHYVPFLSNKRNASGIAEIIYRHPKLNGWEFGGSLAADKGSIYEKNVGCSLRVRKTGILRIR